MVPVPWPLSSFAPNARHIPFSGHVPVLKFPRMVDHCTATSTFHNHESPGGPRPFGPWFPPGALGKGLRSTSPSPHPRLPAPRHPAPYPTEPPPPYHILYPDSFNYPLPPPYAPPPPYHPQPSQSNNGYTPTHTTPSPLRHHHHQPSNIPPPPPYSYYYPDPPAASSPSPPLPPTSPLSVPQADSSQAQPWTATTRRRRNQAERRIAALEEELTHLRTLLARAPPARPPEACPADGADSDSNPWAPLRPRRRPRVGRKGGSGPPLTMPYPDPPGRNPQQQQQQMSTCNQAPHTSSVRSISLNQQYPPIDHGRCSR
jgi:hypothetical protein